jgi:hypothetical protein
VFDAAKDALKSAYEETRRRFIEPDGPPETLHHYCRKDTGLKILSSRHLWASDILRLNDQTEISYPLCDVIDTVAHERAGGLPKYIIQSVKSVGIVRSVWSGWCTHIACLSSKVDIRSQWERYADHGTGCAIGFDRVALTDVCTQLVVSLFPVIYDRQRQETIVRTFLECATSIELNRCLRPPVREEFRKDAQQRVPKLS